MRKPSFRYTHWILGLLALLGLVAAAGAAEDQVAGKTTFMRDVLPILQENCQDCHRSAGANYSGMVAPMSLVTYEETRPWAKSIARQVSSRQMPPWDAAPEFHGVFQNERTLTEEEIDTLVRWARGGALRGNPADAPPPRHYPDNDGWYLGTPDLILQVPSYFIADDIADIYVTHTTDLTDDELPEDRYVRSVEYKPGPAVHHIIARGLGGLAPGSDPRVVPEGHARVLQRGQRISWQMHYHKESGPGTGITDFTIVGIRFHPKDMQVSHRLGGGAVGNVTFEIPPGHPNWRVGANEVMTEDTYLFAMMPHMHLRGKAVKYVAYYPDGGEEALLEVPEYDFNWQTRYELEEPKFLPAGTRIEVTMWFDNSAARREQAPEINPNRPVRFGQPTTDEMALGWYTTITPVQTGNQEPVSVSDAGSR